MLRACSCWSSFENYFWYNNHNLFEEHASQQKAVVTTPARVLAIRLLCLFVIMWNFISSLAGGLNNFNNVRFLTRWGVWLTTFVVIMGLFHTPYKKIIRFDEPTLKQRFNPAAAWKWYVLLYEFCIVADILITFIFWTTLWGYMKETPNHKGHTWAMMNLVLEHSSPLFVMTIDYIFTSTIPLCIRHLPGIVGIFVAYLLCNMTWQLTTGKPVYPNMDWTKGAGLGTIALCVVLVIAVFFLMVHVTKWKLRRLGHWQMVAVVEGRARCEFMKES